MIVSIFRKRETTVSCREYSKICRTFSKSADSAICSKCGKPCGAFCTWILILSVQVRHAFLIGGKIKKIKLYVPQAAEFYKRMGGTYARSETDEQGNAYPINAYPILYMRVK